MKKRILSLMLMLAMLCAFVVIPMGASATESGTCGDNVTWTLDDDGTLTISGSGDMENYYNGGAPWYSNREGIKTVLISDSVTSIGDSAFYNCTGLTSITIPDSVTSIGSEAFEFCTGLTGLTIPDSVTSISWSAFEDCTGLTSITIPQNVTKIGSSAFSGCGKLMIYADENNEYYSSADGVLFNKDQSKIILYAKDKIESEYIIPDGITSINVHKEPQKNRIKSMVLRQRQSMQKYFI